MPQTTISKVTDKIRWRWLLCPQTCIEEMRVGEISTLIDRETIEEGSIEEGGAIFDILLYRSGH